MARDDSRSRVLGLPLASQPSEMAIYHLGAEMVWLRPSFFFQAEDGIRDIGVTGVQTCALPIFDVLAGAGLGHGATSRSSRARAARRVRPDEVRRRASLPPAASPRRHRGLPVSSG